ncbi:MAG: glycine betaine ABC transporter substrate-binding protein [Actinomycetota bacterium]|nr:glycine betaine ABC transporter substrate-binding protein [Actinomycetota bacterium]
MRLMSMSALCLLAIVLSVVAAGCTGGAGGSGNLGGGEGEQKVDLSGLEITVGSKEFTEQLVLGQIAIQALKARGATVTDRTGLASTDAAREALTSGQIDAYWEYTGTGWLVHLNHNEPIPNPQRQYDAVAEEDLSENRLRWLKPAPANNAYAIAVRSEAAGVLGVTSLSELAVLTELRPENATLCAESEFLDRELDGLPGMEEAYDFQFPEDNIVEMDAGQIYQVIDEGEECIFGEVFETDGRIEAFDLTLLKDDENFLPIYNPSLNVREEIMDDYPGIAEVLTPISRKLDNETLRGLNAAVDVDRERPEDVARQFLRENGLL